MTQKPFGTPQIPPRVVAPKRWQGMAVGSAIALAAAPVLAQDLSFTAPASQGGWLWLAQAEGGEGGESGALVDGADAENPGAYLTELALVEGHLRVGFALYAADRADLAVTHMKHPQDEIYAALEPELAEYGASGFAEELTALATSVEAQKPLPEVEAAYVAVIAKITAARAAPGPSPRAAFDAIVAATRVAADEYAIGVVDGKIANLHEYQDAWGFIETAKAMADELIASADPTVSAAATEVRKALEGTAVAFDGLTPDAIEGQETVIIAAAGAIELAAFKVK